MPAVQHRQEYSCEKHLFALHDNDFPKPVTIVYILEVHDTLKPSP